MIHHELNCPKPGTELATGTKGDTMERCTYCRAWAPIGNTRRRPAVTANPPAPTDAVHAPMTAATIKHRDSCTDPTSALETFTGRLGDTLEGCPACHAFKVKRDTPPPAPLAPPARYVCRDHGHPVSWRGRGCPQCTRFLSLSPAARRRARMAEQ